jgi:hypothetical protein
MMPLYGSGTLWLSVTAIPRVLIMHVHPYMHCVLCAPIPPGGYRYHGSTAAAKSALPYDAGFESVGVVVAVGPPPSSSTSSSSGSSSSGSGSSGRQAHQEQQVAVGQAVATMDAGFSEYGVVPINRLLQVRG